MEADMSKIAGSVLDVADVVEKMMVYQSSHLYRLETNRQVEQTQMNAYSALQNLFGSFQTSLTNLSNAFSGSLAYQVNSSNSGVSTGVVTNNDIGLGSHSVVVNKLATAQAFSSQVQFASKTASLNFNETLTFTNTANPATNLSLNIKPNMAQTDIRDSINNSDNNDTGISAAIITSTADDGSLQYNLVLTCNTGTANQVTITGDTDSGTGNPDFNFAQTASAQDAMFTFDGYNEVSSSNTVSNVIDGLTFNLNGVGSATLTVTESAATDTSDVQTAISGMLTSYNNIISFLDANQYVAVYDDKTKQFSSGLNSSFQFIKSQLQSVMGMTFQTSGDIQNLYSAGIIKAPSTTVVDQYDPRRTKVASIGQMMINQTPNPNLDNNTTLNWALSNDYESLNAFFNDPNGFVFNMNNIVTNNILGASSTGLISGSQSLIQSTMSNTDTLIRNEEDRLKGVRDSLITKYARLNASLATFQGLSDYLDKQYTYLDQLISGK
jgi:flagellar hook-associated protein 2